MPSLPPFETEGLPEMYVKYFGFEIEGGFGTEIAGGDYDDSYCDNCDSESCDCFTRRRGAHEYFKEDCSVRSENYMEGEIASPKFRIDRMPQFEEFTKTCMPLDSNYSSGVHIHLSFNNDLAYQKTMDREFYNKFSKEVYDFVCGDNSGFSDKTNELFFNRFHGILTERTNYCADSLESDGQVNGRTGLETINNGRYTRINYPYNAHKTIECRLFPSTEIRSELISMVTWFINFTNEYLKNVPSYERARKNQVSFTEEIENEVEIICV